MGTLKRGRTDTDTYTSKDGAGRFVGAGCAALPALVLSLIETCLRIARKLKLPSIVVHWTKRTKVAQEDQHDKIWRNNSRANVRPSGEKTSLIKLKNLDMWG